MSNSSSEPLLPTQETTATESSSTMPGLLSLPVARVLAPLSFVFDFLSQQYGINIHKPDMKQISDRHPAAFSPHPYAIAGFFGPQQIFQLVWLRQLFKNPSEVEECVLELAGWYSLGNFLIGTWQFFWSAEDMVKANYCVIANTAWGLWWVFTRRTNGDTYQQRLTNIIGITFAGVGVLDLLHNGSIAWAPSQAPNLMVKAATVLGLPLLAYAGPPLFGACIAYDLFGVAIGQRQLANKALDGLGGGGGHGWSMLVGFTAVLAAAGTAIKYMQTGKFVS